MRFLIKVVLILSLLNPFVISAELSSPEWTPTRIAFTAIEFGLLVNSIDIIKSKKKSVSTPAGNLEAYLVTTNYFSTYNDYLSNVQLYGYLYKYKEHQYKGGLSGRNLSQVSRIQDDGKFMTMMRNSSLALFGLVLAWDGILSSDLWGKKYSTSTPTTRAIRSAIFPGWGQYHTGHDFKSIFFFSSIIGLLTAQIDAQFRLLNAQYNYKHFRENYFGNYFLYTDDFDIITLTYFSENLKVRKKLGSASRAAHQNLSAILGLWIINIIDAAIFENADKKTTSFWFQPDIHWDKFQIGNTILSEMNYGLTLNFRL
ncbi:MAG: hypothetical protein KDK90_23875 [Leptospiraceae bacterium]|nr:hypothetical protein [Leptospiraceae bacterium]